MAGDERMDQGRPQTATGDAGGKAEGGAKPAIPTRGPAVWPLHPFLFAAASVLTLYTSNLHDMWFADVVPTLATVLGSAAVLYLVACLLLGFRTRAAIVASLFLIAVLYRADILGWLNGLLDSALPRDAALPLLLGAAAVLSALAIRTRLRLVVPNAILNGIAFVLLVTPLWSALSYAWETDSLPRPAAAEAPLPEPAGTVAAAPGETPDIYYFIFDRYGSAETLQRVYGIDNEPFLETLRERGFFVADESFSNYPKTAPSLAATFHMDYLDFLRDDPLALRNEWHPVYDLLENHRVGTFLKDRGYQLIQIGAWWEPTQRNAAADESYDFGFSEFGWLYLQRTLLPQLVETVMPESDVAGMMGWDNGQCRRVPLQIAQAQAIAARPEATFTFVHVLLPHDPFIFNPDGSCLSREEVRERGREEGYRAQLGYANRLIGQMVDSLLAGEEKPIIILQADEGPYPEEIVGTSFSWTDATTEQLATKSGILNAWYFPDGDYTALYPEITPVNTFRLLFDKYFGAGLGLLPDRVYHFPGYDSIYDFFEVTDVVRQVHDRAD